MVKKIGPAIATIDQCMDGLRDLETKLRVKKPIVLVASDEVLVKNLRGLVCNKRHEHAHLEGTYKGQNKTHLARIWPWELATRIVAGVSAVAQKVQERMFHQAFLAAYPTDGPVERPRTQAARQAARDASGSSDSDANTEDVTGDLSSIE